MTLYPSPSDRGIWSDKDNFRKEAKEGTSQKPLAAKTGQLGLVVNSEKLSTRAVFLQKRLTNPPSLKLECGCGGTCNARRGVRWSWCQVTKVDGQNTKIRRNRWCWLTLHTNLVNMKCEKWLQGPRHSTKGVQQMTRERGDSHWTAKSAE